MVDIHSSEDSDFEMDMNGTVLDENESNESEIDKNELNESEVNENDASETENFADNSSEGEDEPTEGNKGWADVMSRVLQTETKGKKFILSRAKKDADIKNDKEKQIEVVDETGQVIGKKTKEKKTSYSEKRKEMIEKQRLRAEWEAMCHVKPDITKKNQERELVKIATRGVVHLFNTVEKHQKTAKNTKKNTPKDKKLNVVKGKFMDILKECSKKDVKVEDDPAVKKAKREETWSILKDDFMMGAEMKDWDKDDENT